MRPSAKTFLFSVLAVSAFSGCSYHPAEMYPKAVEPYSAFTSDDVHNRECRIEFSDKVLVSGQGAWFDGKTVDISEGGVYTITGSFDGNISVTAEEPVKLIFTDASINSPDGSAIISKSQRLILCSDSGASTLTGCCPEHGTAVCTAGAVLLMGSGNLSLDGGLFSGGEIQFARGVNTFCEIIQNTTGHYVYGNLTIN